MKRTIRTRETRPERRSRDAKPMSVTAAVVDQRKEHVLPQCRFTRNEAGSRTVIVAIACIAPERGTGNIIFNA